MIVFHQSDVSFRRVVGGFLSHGRNLSAKELEQVVLPFAPFRGLTAYYLSVAARLLPDRTGPVGPPSEEGVTRSHPVQAGRKRQARSGAMGPLLGDPNASIVTRQGDHEPQWAESLHDLGYDRNTQTTPDKAEERIVASNRRVTTFSRLDRTAGAGSVRFLIL